MSEFNTEAMLLGLLMDCSKVRLEKIGPPTIDYPVAEWRLHVLSDEHGELEVEGGLFSVLERASAPFLQKWRDRRMDLSKKLVFTHSSLGVAAGMNLEWRAKQFANIAHRSIDQRRKYTNEPYINHPAEVVSIVRLVPHTREMIAAAWLHDVVEDTPITIEQIEEEFGEKVSELVGWLTDVSKPEDGNRATRKALDREHTSKAPPEAKTIKLADLISNTRSIVARDPAFAVVYLAEKRLLLEVLKEGDSQLWQQANILANRPIEKSGQYFEIEAGGVSDV